MVPGTSALRDHGSRTAKLGDLSLLVVPLPGRCRHNITYLLSAEVIRLLQRSPQLEVLAPRSALSLADSRQMGERPAFDPGTNWTLEIGCEPHEQEGKLFADLRRQTGGDPQRLVAERFETGALRPLMLRLSENVLGALGQESPGFELTLGEPDPGAYFNFLKARFLLFAGVSATEPARELLQQVVETEPDWPSGLAEYAYSLVRFSGANPAESDESLAQAKAILEDALTLQPGHPESELYSSVIAHRVDWRWQKAYDAAQAALAGSPGSADIMAAKSTAAFTLGRFEEGIELIRKAIPLDPLVLSHRLKYGLMLEFSGEYQAAIDAYRELMELDPDYPAVRTYLARTLVIAGRPEIALPHMKIETSPFWRNYGMALVLFALGRDQEAEPILDTLIEQHAHEAAVQIAEIHAFTGRTDDAFEWLTLAVQQRDPGVSELLGNPLLRSLESDPRWDDLLEALGLVFSADHEQG